MDAAIESRSDVEFEASDMISCVNSGSRSGIRELSVLHDRQDGWDNVRDDKV
jgi:hypothetical protein